MALAERGTTGLTFASFVLEEQKVRLTPWALEPFLVGVLSAAAAKRKLPHTLMLTLVS